MSKYFKKFITHEEYEAYITSESKILPNVSVCVINKHVHYNPRAKSVTGVTLNKSSLSLSQGASETLVATVLPTGATDKRVTWTSSNSGVATVDSSGKVTAVGSGNATITVRTVDGGFTAQCATSVAVGVTGVTLNKSSLSLNVGASETLVATVLPSTASNKQVTWSSSNSSVATVDSSGKVTAVGSGNATITVRTVDGGFTAQCATSVAVGVTGVTLNKSSLSLNVGASETLVATVLPSTASNKQVTWSSSDSSVAIVDSDGRVTAVGGGNATITVTTVDGGFTAQCATSVVVHEWVEIGGVKWATMNIGATSVTDGGLYFQWGDSQGYTASQVGSGSGQKYFDWTDYKFNPSGDGETFTKYNSWNGQRVLEASDDAARVYWGSDWRMPTWGELTALRDSTDYAWVDNYQDSGVSGYLFTGKPNTSDEGKELFFPSVGRADRGSVKILNNGFYWGSSLFISSESITKHNLNMASYFTFRSNGNYWGKAYRDFGFPVRGVHV